MLDDREQPFHLGADLDVLEQHDVVDERRQPLDADLDLGAEQLLRLLREQRRDVALAQLVRERGDEADRALGVRRREAEAVDAIDHDALDAALVHVLQDQRAELVEAVAQRRLPLELDQPRIDLLCERQPDLTAPSIRRSGDS